MLVKYFMVLLALLATLLATPCEAVTVCFDIQPAEVTELVAARDYYNTLHRWQLTNPEFAKEMALRGSLDLLVNDKKVKELRSALRDGVDNEEARLEGILEFHEPVCGDARIEGGESCDGAEMGNCPVTCEPDCECTPTTTTTTTTVP